MNGKMKRANRHVQLSSCCRTSDQLSHVAGGFLHVMVVATSFGVVMRGSYVGDPRNPQMLEFRYCPFCGQSLLRSPEAEQEKRRQRRKAVVSG